jgi:hypothetical protein
MSQRPYLLPWVRVLLLIRDIRSTTWGHERWPHVSRCSAAPSTCAAGRLRVMVSGIRRAVFGATAQRA